MPLKLVPPRQGKTPYWYIRGTHLGVSVGQSTRTPERRLAAQILRRIRAEIERGEVTPKGGRVEPQEATFLSAAIAYMEAGGERKHLSPILAKLGETPLSQIDQIKIDSVAAELYPTASAQTRNRQFYTPISAILKRAGVDRPLKRPKGWRGKKSISWLEPEQAFRLFDEADKIDAEFGLFLRTLLYTGMRLSEALRARMKHLDLARSNLYLPETKNSEPRSVFLPPAIIVAFANQPPRPERGKNLGRNPKRGETGRRQAEAGVNFLERHPESKIFRFHASGALRDMLKKAMKNAKLSFPRRQGGFHIFCHTYGTWMHRYGNLDTYGLTRTNRWKDPRSADRYKHTAASEESRRAGLLPTAETAKP